jgi:hypothetical protein
MQTNSDCLILDAITATNTPVAIDVSDVSKMTIAISSAGTFNARSGVLTVTASVDGINYAAYNMLITNTTNAITEGLVRVAATTAISTTAQCAFYYIDTTPFKYLKFLLTITDGGSPTGNYSVHLCKQYHPSL